jgi:hypothetical protein
MAFLAPFLLWGTLAAGIPVAIHLFFRSRYRTVPWAAMKFLLTSVEQTSRRLRFQELLLLMLRILLLVVLAMALARPVLSSFREMALLGFFVFVQAFAVARFTTSARRRFVGKLAEFGAFEAGGLLLLGLLWFVSPSEGALGGRGDAVDAVFVFDTSMSMGARDGAKTRLERARAEAMRIVDQLPAHSTMHVVVCAGGGESLLGPRSPANLDQARDLIGELATTDLSTDLFAGVKRGSEILKHGQSPNKELYVFSDMQKQGWDKNAGDLKQELEAVKEKASVVLVRCGTNPVKNVAVVGITPQSEIPRPGERVGFAVLVRNTGAEAVEKLTVTLAVDGDTKAIESQTLPYIGPGETKAIALTARLEKPGLRVLTAKVGPDDLDGDNRLDQVVQVRDFVNVLVVDGAFDERDPAKSSSYFLMHALAPVKDVARSTYYLQPKVVPARLASPALLAKADLCFLVNVSLQPKIGIKGDAAPADFVEELGRFVRQGHGLVVFAGDNVRADAYNQLLGKKQGLLPLPIKGTYRASAGAPLLVDRESFALPAFGKFKDDDYYKDFSKVEVWQALDLIEPVAKDDDAKPKAEDESVTVVLRANDGKPLIATRKVDAGEVVFVATATDFELDPKTQNAAWTDWPFHLGVYIPFVHTLIGHLLHGQSESYNVTAGETLHWYPTEKSLRSYTLMQPDGKAIRLGQAEKKGKRLEVTANELPQAGVYHLIAHLPRIGDDAESPGTILKDAGIPIAAGADLRETADLSTFSDAEIDGKLNFTPIHLIADTGAETFSVADRLNREWTAWLLVAVLVLMVCEALLAWVCGRAW